MQGAGLRGGGEAGRSGFWCLAVAVAVAAALQAEPVELELIGDWRVRARTASPGRDWGAWMTLAVTPSAERRVVGERYDALPLFQPNAAGWQKGVVLRGLATQETSAKGQLDPSSLELRTGPGADGTLLEAGRDYAVDLEWGTIGRLAGGHVGEGQPVFASYRHGESRLDSVILDETGGLSLREGRPHVTAPRPVELQRGEVRLANVYVPGRMSRLTPDQLFPVLERAFPEPARTSPTPAERWLPRTVERLRSGQSVRVLAWGDSVTDAGYLPNPDRERWQAQFVQRLRARFPKAKIELITEAWGGRNTGSYLAEPPGSPHNYREKVLGAKPDLVVSEFVNDAGLSPAQVEEVYGRLLADFREIGAEWIVLTPHYVRPDWMGLTREREIDEDPRPYVQGLREFAARHGVALGDAAARWGRLWRQGLPYTTLFLNAINHPDARGMKLFADSLMALFP